MATNKYLCTCKDFVSSPCFEHAIRIEEWRLVYYKRNKKLTALEGKVDGSLDVTTTEPLVQASGVFARTKDNTWYLLGTPRESWLKWLEEHKHVYKPDDPLRIKGKQ